MPPLSTNLGIDRELETNLIARTHRILLDFDDGVYHMASDLAHRGGINIGSINQMAGHIGNNNQGTVRAQQSVNETDVLVALASAITAQVGEADERNRILEAIEAMTRVKDDKVALGTAYASFISLAAAHMTVVAPFLPALAQMLT